jgi:hypothetical protein
LAHCGRLNSKCSFPQCQNFLRQEVVPAYRRALRVRRRRSILVRGDLLPRLQLGHEPLRHRNIDELRQRRGVVGILLERLLERLQGGRRLARHVRASADQSAPLVLAPVTSDGRNFEEPHEFLAQGRSIVAAPTSEGLALLLLSKSTKRDHRWCGRAMVAVGIAAFLILAWRLDRALFIVVLVLAIVLLLVRILVLLELVRIIRALIIGRDEAHVDEGGSSFEYLRVVEQVLGECWEAVR